MENKSIGGALVDVFDAAVSLIKSEITAITRRVGNIAKAKGLGVVLLLASLVPLTLALIFLILFVFYGLIRLGLAAWSASLILGIVSLLVTGGLIFVALKRLGSDVPDDTAPPAPLSDIQKDDLKYGSGKTPGPDATRPGAPTSAPGPAGGVAVQGWQAHTPNPSSTGHTTGGHPAGEDAASAPSRAEQATGAGQGRLQSTSTQGKPSASPEQAGIPVTTHPTYPDDMKKEGY